MDNLAMWKRFKSYLCVCDSVGVTVDISRMKFSDGFLEEKDADMPARLRRDGRAREAARSPTPTRSAWSATTGCATPELAPDADDLRSEIDETLAAHQDVRRATCTPARSSRRRRSASRTCWSSASAARRSGPQFVADALGTPSATGCSRTSSTTPIPTASTACSRSSATQLDETLVVVDLQVRRHQGDAQRHARGRSAPTTRAGLDVRASTPSRSPATAASSTTTPSQTGWLRALPDVGLGRRPHLGAVARWACCRRRCRASTSTRMLAGARGDGRGDPRARTRAEPRRAARAHVVPRRRRPRREGHGGPAVQGPARAVLAATCSSS